MSIVVYSLFLLTMMILMLVGILVLLYCASYYVFRGGPSTDGVDCGAFFILARRDAFTAYWHFGVALDCFILYCPWWSF